MCGGRLTHLILGSDRFARVSPVHLHLNQSSRLGVRLLPILICGKIPDWLFPSVMSCEPVFWFWSRLYSGSNCELWFKLGFIQPGRAGSWIEVQSKLGNDHTCCYPPPIMDVSAPLNVTSLWLVTRQCTAAAKYSCSVFVARNAAKCSWSYPYTNDDKWEKILQLNESFVIWLRLWDPCLHCSDVAHKLDDLWAVHSSIPMLLMLSQWYFLHCFLTWSGYDWKYAFISAKQQPTWWVVSSVFQALRDGMKQERLFEGVCGYQRGYRTLPSKQIIWGATAGCLSTYNGCNICYFKRLFCDVLMALRQ